MDRSTLAGQVGASSQVLTPLVEDVRRHVTSASKDHADDTPGFPHILVSVRIVLRGNLLQRGARWVVTQANQNERDIDTMRSDATLCNVAFFGS